MKKKIWEICKQLKLTQEEIENLERTKRLNLSSKSSKQRKVQHQTILMVNFDKHLGKKKNLTAIFPKLPWKIEKDEMFSNSFYEASIPSYQSQITILQERTITIIFYEYPCKNIHQIACKLNATAYENDYIPQTSKTYPTNMSGSI